MYFYSSIAKYYNDIFPMKPAQLNFVQSAFPSLKKLNILDIGCATGKLAVQLAKEAKFVVGIDLDRHMLKHALNDKPDHLENLQYMPLDMQHVETHFGVYAFDLILCFGNTLPHLQSEKHILNFLSQAKGVLKTNGKFQIQLINYDRILDQHITSLPTIENENISFERLYKHNQQSGLIDFKTILTIKASNTRLKNTISLYPIRKEILIQQMKSVGLSNIKIYSDFKRKPYSKNSIPLVIEAS